MGPQESHFDNDAWRLRAECRSADPDLFFPDGYGKSHEPDVNAAKAFCGMCAVQAFCLEAALQNNEQHGIWGGTTPDERRAILKRRRAS